RSALCCNRVLRTNGSWERAAKGLAAFLQILSGCSLIHGLRERFNYGLPTGILGMSRLMLKLG
ncbi:MAG: hypothetical protein K0B16_19495, partial [Burkholderiaceae bacterium]|nr:hypothetical protein [Burkholderiaceae bacterium]